MARGVSRLLGIELMRNFRAPYLSTSFRDFWTRWHISLSQWLRDYVYISFGGNRVRLRLRYRNLMLTMLIGGIWHGAGWNFVIWGGLHGLYLVANTALSQLGLGRNSRLASGVRAGFGWG
jgi:D-alanyl-lipoteichoic acid acyltransferase DltB (MBOAT superfamily)